MSVKNALLLAVALVVSLAFVEMLTRTFFPDPPAPFVASHDFRLIYELNPRDPEINSLGMRDDEVDLSSLHDHFVIAVIGDSHAYGVHSKRQDSFPARLQYHLRALTGKQVRVLNLGVPGYDMAQELEVLRAKALRFKPDLVILQYCINDEHISNYIQPKYVWLNDALNRSLFVTRLWTRFLYSPFGQKHVEAYVERYAPDLLLAYPGLVGTEIAREDDPAHALHPPRSKDQVPVKYHDFIGRDNLERDVRVFGQTSTKEGIPAIATGFIEPHDERLYEDAGFQVLSFLKIFDGMKMQDYGYNPSNTFTHFNERGADVIGEALANFVNGNFDVSKQ